MIYELEKKLSYNNGGQKSETNILEIEAPSNKQQKYAAIIDQELNRALMEMSSRMAGVESKSSAEDSDVDSKTILMMLIGNGGNLDLCLNALKELLIRGAKLDGEGKFTEYHFESLSYNETKKILGEYIKSFLYSSLQA